MGRIYCISSRGGRSFFLARDSERRVVVSDGKKSSIRQIFASRRHNSTSSSSFVIYIHELATQRINYRDKDARARANEFQSRGGEYKCDLNIHIYAGAIRLLLNYAND